MRRKKYEKPKCCSIILRLVGNLTNLCVPNHSMWPADNTDASEYSYNDL